MESVHKFYPLKVMILGGKDRGKIGKINEVVRSKNWVFVEGLNTVIHSFY